MICTNKFIQNDDYINNINDTYKELIKTYDDGDLVEVPKDFSNRDWFYMEYDKNAKKYIFNKKELDKLMKIYTSKMNNDSFYMKFYEDAQNRNLSIYSKLTNNEIGTYIPDVKLLIINKEYLNEYNEMIKDELNTILEVNKLSFFEIRPHNN